MAMRRGITGESFLLAVPIFGEREEGMETA